MNDGRHEGGENPQTIFTSGFEAEGLIPIRQLDASASLLHQMAILLVDWEWP